SPIADAVTAALSTIEGAEINLANADGELSVDVVFDGAAGQAPAVPGAIHVVCCPAPADQPPCESLIDTPCGVASVVVHCAGNLGQRPPSELAVLLRQAVAGGASNVFLQARPQELHVVEPERPGTAPPPPHT